jgi:hypothetical protein
MRKQCQRVAAKFGFAFVVVLIECSLTPAQDVRTNYLPGTDFSKYHTYKWVTIGETGAPDQILDAQIKQSIDSQLVAKGLTRVDTDKPDLLIRYQVAVTKEREWNANGQGFGFPGGFPVFDSGTATATSSTIHVGTLVLDIYDPGAKQLVWTGSASKTIDNSKDPQKIQKNLNKAMQKLLKDFPPGRK